MSFKRNLIIALMLIIVATLYFYLFSTKKKREYEVEKSLRLFTHPIDRVAMVSLKNSHGDFLLKKEENTWYLKSPVERKADQDIVTVLLSNLAGAKKSNIFESDEIEPYGLDSPRAQVTLTFVDPERSVTILFGDRSAAAGKHFCKIKAEEDIFVVSSHVYNAIEKNVYDLRDKTILSINPGNVVAFTLETKFGKVEAAKKDNDWYLTHPVYFPGDQQEISSIFQSINSNDVMDFLELTSATLATTELNTPKISFSVTELSDEDPATTRTKSLYIGKSTELNHYAYTDKGDDILLVSRDLVVDLNQHPHKYRKTELFPLNTVDVDQIILAHNDTTFSLIRGDDKSWYMKENGNAPCNDEKVKEILTQIISLRIVKFVEDMPASWNEYGLENPAFSVTLIDRDTNQRERLDVGRAVIQEEYFFARKNDLNTVFLISKSVQDMLALDRRDFYDTAQDSIRGIDEKNI